MSGVVYFSKMFQAVPHLAQVARVLPGTFVSNRSSTLNAARSLYPEMETARYSRWLGGLAAGNRFLAQADVIVTGAPNRRFLAGYKARTCSVFHGTFMLLSRETLLGNAHFDLLCVIGPRMQQMIDRHAHEIPVSTVRTGFLPFCEFPEQSPRQREHTLLGLGLDPMKQTILYTPSRRGVGSWDRMAEALVEQTPQVFNLVLRPHPSQALTSRASDRASFGRVKALASNRPHTVVDLAEKPLSALLSVANLVVSDANSPAEESLFYDVPQLMIETPGLSRDVMRAMADAEGMHVEDTERLLTLYGCGPNLFLDQSPRSLAQVLERAIEDQARYRQHRGDYFSWVFGSRDRFANQRVREAVTNHLLNR